MNIRVTPKARERIARIAKDKNMDSPVIRIIMEGFGWGGPSYGIALDKQKDNDHVENYEDVAYVVEKDLLEMGGEFRVDYQNNFFAKGFTVIPAGWAGSSC